MELVLMVLFFSISAAICLQVFASAQLISRESRDLANASVQAQSAAAVYKSTCDLQQTAALLGGASTETTVTLLFDKNWEPVDNFPVYYLLLREGNDSTTIGVFKNDGGTSSIDREAVFFLTVKAVNYGR